MLKVTWLWVEFTGQELTGNMSPLWLLNYYMFTCGPNCHHLFPCAVFLYLVRLLCYSNYNLQLILQRNLLKIKAGNYLVYSKNGYK